MKDGYKKSSNDGTADSSAGRGDTWRESYGRDNSSHCGTKQAERGKKMGGGVTNLAHSIPGPANQKGS